MVEKNENMEIQIQYKARPHVVFGLASYDWCNVEKYLLTFWLVYVHVVLNSYCYHRFQASSLLLAIVLRALLSDHSINHDMERDYDVIGRTREPLLDPRLSQTSGLAKADAKVGHSDIWSSRMKEKVCFIGV